MTQTDTTNPSSLPAPVRRPGRWKRLTMRSALVALLLLVLTVIVLNRTNALGMVVLPQVSKMFNCNATAGRVTLSLNGDLLVRDLELRAPGIDGTAGTFLSAPRVVITPRWGSLITGSPSAARLALHRPLIRLSQDRELALNVASLQASGAPSGGLVPEISLLDCTIEFGEHDHANYRKLTELHVEGTLERLDPSSALYTFELREDRSRNQPSGLAQADDFSPLHVIGDFDLRTLSGKVSLGNFDLRRLSISKVPTALQELWTGMAMAGTVKQTAFSYDTTSGVQARFELVQVDLNIPIPSDHSPDELDGSEPLEDSGSNEWLAMRSVSGQAIFTPNGLTADLKGTIEDLDCKVLLRTESLALNSALRCEIEASQFVVGDQPRLLPFAPWVVRRNFERFSGPTAMVNGNVVLVRPAPVDGVASEMIVRGQLDFEHGNAQFEAFQYPFHDMSGRISFDEREVRIEQLHADGPTGAHLLAQGVIAPPTLDAGVKLFITVTQAPFDQHLLDALPPDRRDLVNTIFDAQAYENLRLAGLIEPSEERRRRNLRLTQLEMRRRRAEAGSENAGDLQETLAELSRLRAVNDRIVPFDLGGMIKLIEIRILRDPGAESQYKTEIDVVIPSAGLLASRFPYPAIAQDFKLMVTDTKATVSTKGLTGLTGAEGSLEATIGFSSEDDGPSAYDLRIDASTIAIDEFLLSAIPQGNGGSSLNPRQVVRNLNLEGHGSCTAKVFDRDDGSLGYEIDVKLEGLSSKPEDGRLQIERVTGDIVITDQALSVQELTASIGAGTIQTSFTAALASGANGVSLPLFTGRIKLEDFEADRPIEALLGTVRPDLEQSITSLRRKYAPAGWLDADCHFRLNEGESLDYDLRVTNAREVGVNLFGGRVVLDDCTGSIALNPTSASWDRFGASVAFDDAHAARVSLDGDWPLNRRDDSSGGEVLITLDRARFESPMIRELIGNVDGAIAEAFEAAKVRGVFSASGSVRAMPGQQPTVEGELRPHSLSVQRHGQDIHFDRFDGRITIEGDRGKLDKLVAVAPSWSLEVDGDWSMQPTLGINALFSLHAATLSQDLRSLLPEAGQVALESVDINIEGPLIIRDGTLQYALADDGSVALLDVLAQADFGATTLNAVVPIEIRSGHATIEAGIDTQTGAAHLDTTISAQSLTAAGIQMSQGKVRLMMGQSPGVFTVPLFSAQTHGGEIVARVGLHPSPRGPTSSSMNLGTAYELDLRASGIDFATFLESLKLAGDDQQVQDEATQDELAQFGSRGELDATFQIAGDTADPQSRRGRGLLRVQNGEVVKLPGVMGLLRLSNLQPPIGEKLEYASAGLFLRGDSITFDHIEASSASVVIAGYGTLGWPGLDLDLQFNTRGNRGIPILSDLLRGVRNELLTTHVTGTLRDPEYTIEQLPATRRMLGSIFRGQPKTPPTAAPMPRGSRSSPNDGE